VLPFTNPFTDESLIEMEYSRTKTAYQGCVCERCIFLKVLSLGNVIGSEIQLADMIVIKLRQPFEYRPGTVPSHNWLNLHQVVPGRNQIDVRGISACFPRSQEISETPSQYIRRSARSALSSQCRVSMSVSKWRRPFSSTNFRDKLSNSLVSVNRWWGLGSTGSASNLPSCPP
jgi:hypothetical protein